MKFNGWIFVGMAGVIIILAYLLFHKPGSTKDLPVLIAKNDSLKKVIVKADSVDRVRSIALKLHDSLRDARLDSALNIIARNKDSLKQAKNALIVAIDNLGDAVNETLDTSLIHKFDSVSLKLMEAYRIVNDYSDNNDTIIRLFDGELRYKDSVIVALNIEIKGLKSGLTSSVLNFDALQKDNATLQKKIKRQSLVSKIGTTLGVILGYVIGHSVK